MLPNKVKIATQEMNSPLTCVTLAVAAGPRYETCWTNGLTHFIEHMAFRGCRTLTTEQMEKILIDMGAKMTAHTSKEEQMFSILMPSENALSAVDLLFKIVTELDIDDCQIQLERENICRELADTDTDPKKVLFDYLTATAFQGTPLGQQVIGPSENICRFNSDIASTFMCENYVPYRLCLVSAGKLNHNQLLSAAKPNFGCIASVPIGEPEQGPNRFTGSQVLYRDDSMPFCHVAISFEAPGYLSPDYYKMLLLNCIVGSWDRSQARELSQAPPVARWVALDKLCELYEPFYIAYRDVGLWGVYFVADKWKLDEVVSRLQDQWMELCTVVSTGEIERGTNLAMLNVARWYSNVEWSAHDLGKQVLYNCGRKSMDMVIKGLKEVNPAELRALAYRHLYDRCPAVAVVGPSETMPDYVRIRGGMWWLRL